MSFFRWLSSGEDPEVFQSFWNIYGFWYMLLCIYPNRNKARGLIYFYVTFFCMSVMTTFYIGFYVSLILQAVKWNITYACIILNYYIGAVLSTTIFYTPHIHREKLKRLHLMAYSGFYKYESKIKSDVESEQMRTLIRRYFFVFPVTLLLASLTPIIMKLEPDVSMDLDYSLPYPCRYPWSTRDSSFVFSVTVFSQFLLISFVVGFISWGVYSFLNHFMTWYIEMEKLINSLSDIDQRAASMYSLTNTVKDVLYEDPQYQECVMRCLKENIHHHQILTSFVKDIIHVSGLVIFISSVTMAFTTAASFTSMTLTESTIGFKASGLVFTCASLLGTFMICYVGQKVVDQEEVFHNTVCDLEWFKMSPTNKKIICIWMSKTIKPFRPRALGFVYYDMELFKKMMSASYTYFQYFRLYSLYEKGELNELIL